jgi:uncharacterized protein DUF4115
MTVSKQKAFSAKKLLNKKKKKNVRRNATHQTLMGFITKRYKKFFYYGAAFIIILYLFLHFSNMFLKDIHQIPQASRHVVVNELNKSSATPELLNSQKKGFDGIVVMVRPTSKTWMRVYVDGIVSFKGPVDRGLIKLFQGKKYVRLRVGNGSAVNLMVNKKYYGKLSREEKLIDKRFYPLSTEEMISVNNSESEYKIPGFNYPEIRTMSGPRAGTANSKNDTNNKNQNSEGPNWLW